MSSPLLRGESHRRMRRISTTSALRSVTVVGKCDRTRQRENRRQYQGRRRLPTGGIVIACCAASARTAQRAVWSPLWLSASAGFLRCAFSFPPTDRSSGVVSPTSWSCGCGRVTGRCGQWCASATIRAGPAPWLCQQLAFSGFTAAPAESAFGSTSVRSVAGFRADARWWPEGTLDHDPIELRRDGRRKAMCQPSVSGRFRP